MTDFGIVVSPPGTHAFSKWWPHPMFMGFKMACLNATFWLNQTEAFREMYHAALDDTKCSDEERNQHRNYQNGCDRAYQLCQSRKRILVRNSLIFYITYRQQLTRVSGDLLKKEVNLWVIAECDDYFDQNRRMEPHDLMNISPPPVRNFMDRLIDAQDISISIRNIIVAKYNKVLEVYDRRLAFCMARHERLGEQAWLKQELPRDHLRVTTNAHRRQKTARQQQLVEIKKAESQAFGVIRNQDDDSIFQLIIKYLSVEFDEINLQEEQPDEAQEDDAFDED